jgi:peptidoglycan/xylan/chitin deacetylase (PgdA/CDA1 family)
MSKRRILISVFSFVFVLLFLSFGYIRQNYVVPVLMYHSVNPDARPQNRLAISVEAFERQMHFLKNNHYHVLPLDSVAGLIREKRKIPHKTVAITFDDGYKDNYTYAFPVLKKYSLPATIFVIINEVGRADRLSWDEIKTIQDSGIINFGSHALGPEPLINIQSEEALRKEIFDSKKILEEKLGRRITVFSYPGGMSNSKIRKLVIDAGYKFAVATNPGKKFADDDLFALKRLRISSSSNNLFVFWVEASGYYNFIRERRHK